MSNRFQHQLSSASTKRFAKPPTPLHAGQVSKPASASKRFVLSSTQQAASPTPGPHRSRFQDKPQLKDEIETSFEEAKPASQLPSRLRFSSSVSHYQLADDVDEGDHDENEDTNSASNPSAVKSRRGPVAAVQVESEEDDSLADLEFLERLRGTRPSQHSKTIDIDSNTSSHSDLDFDSDSDLMATTPLQPRKRRRLNDRAKYDEISTLDQADFTKPSTTSAPPRSNQKLTSPLEGASNSDDEIASSLLPSLPSVNITNPTPRFKLPSTRPHLSLHRHLDPAAASAATTPTTTETPTPAHPPTKQKPTFRPLSTPIPNPTPSFTHPHKPHQPPYLPHGAASTIRNLIIGLADTHLQPTPPTRSSNERASTGPDQIARARRNIHPGKRTEKAKPVHAERIRNQVTPSDGKVKTNVKLTIARVLPSQRRGYRAHAAADSDRAGQCVFVVAEGGGGGGGVVGGEGEAEGERARVWALIGAESDLHTISHTLNLRGMGVVRDASMAATAAAATGAKKVRKRDGRENRLRCGRTVFVGLGWDVHLPFRVPGYVHVHVHGSGGRGRDQKHGSVDDDGRGGEGNAYEPGNGRGLGMERQGQGDGGEEEEEGEEEDDDDEHQRDAAHKVSKEQGGEYIEGGGMQLCKVGIAALWCVLDDDGTDDDNDDEEEEGNG
jgi:hypothetical protein